MIKGILERGSKEIFLIGVVHVLLGSLLLNSMSGVVIGSLLIVTALFSPKVPTLKVDKIKFLSLITLSTYILAFLLNTSNLPNFYLYVLFTMVMIPVGARLINKTKHQAYFFGYVLILTFILISQLGFSKMASVGLSYATCLSIIFIFSLFSEKRFFLTQRFIKKKNDIENIIKSFPDALVRRRKTSYTLLNEAQISLNFDLKEKLYSHSKSGMDSVEIEHEGSFYEVRLHKISVDEDIFYIKDITDRMVSVKELETHRLQLTNSSKLAALGEMAGGVAHEINNPLQSLMLYTDQMRFFLSMNDKLDGTDRAPMEKICDDMESTIDRINNIVKGMRLISRDGQSDSYEDVDIRELVKETLSLCNEKFRNHSVNLYLYEEEGKNYVIQAQRVRLSQVILNILNNAYDAIRDNNSRNVKIYLSNSEGQVKLAISDNGPGVPKDLEEKVFQPFFTTKPIGKGTGLGLSISKGIIEQHKGVFCLDEEDKSKFIISIPEVKGV